MLRGLLTARPTLLRVWLRRRPVEPELPVRLPEVLLDEVRTLVSRGRTVEAVRVVRRRTGLSLLLAVRAVEALGASDRDQREGDEDDRVRG